MPSDFLIQHIDLDKFPDQAHEYARGLTARIKELDLNFVDIANEIAADVSEVEQLAAGTHPMPNRLMKKLWDSKGWHPETLILKGAGWI